MSNSNSFGNNLASFGKLYAMVSLVICTVVAIGIALLGIDLLMKKDPNDPHKDREGLMLIVIAVVMVAISYGFVWMTKNYKLGAQIEGVIGCASLLLPVFGGLLLKSKA